LKATVIEGVRKELRIDRVVKREREWWTQTQKEVHLRRRRSGSGTTTLASVE